MIVVSLKQVRTSERSSRLWMSVNSSASCSIASDSILISYFLRFHSQESQSYTCFSNHWYRRTQNWHGRWHCITDFIFKADVECIEFIRSGPIVASDTACLCYVAHYNMQAMAQTTHILVITSRFQLSVEFPQHCEES